MRDVFQRMAAEAGVAATTTELTGYLGITPDGSAPRLPDMVLHGLRDQPTLLDFTFSNPFCPTYLARACHGRLAVARHAAAAKVTKYGQPGYNPHAYPFVPLAGEFGGGVCDQWTHLVDALATAYLDTSRHRLSGLTAADGKARFVRWWGLILSSVAAKAQHTFVAAQVAVGTVASDASSRFPAFGGDCSSERMIYF